MFMILKTHKRKIDVGSLDAFNVAPPGFPGIFSRKFVTQRCSVPYHWLIWLHRPNSSLPPFRSFGVPRLVLSEMELNSGLLETESSKPFKALQVWVDNPLALAGVEY